MRRLLASSHPLLLVALVSHLGTSALARPQERFQAEIVSALEKLESDQNPDSQAVAHRLTAMGPEATAAVFAVLVEGRYSDGPDGVLGPEQRASLIAVLQAWPAARVVKDVVAAVRPEDSLSKRLLAIEVVGATGSAPTLDAFLDLVAGVPPPVLQTPVTQEIVKTGLRDLLAREPHALLGLARLVRSGQLDPTVVELSIRAVALVPHREATGLLERIQRDEPQWKLVILEALGTVGIAGSPEVRRHAARILSRALASTDPRARQQAAVSLGRLQNTEFIGELIELLDDGGRVRRKARWALTEITGHSWSEQDRWRRWYAAENDWFASEGDARIEEVYGPDRGRALEALRQLAKHDLFRIELTDALIEAIRHEDPKVAAGVCTTLGRLSDPGSLVHLIAALEDDRGGVADAALRALHGITGTKLPGSPELWHRWLENPYASASRS